MTVALKPSSSLGKYLDTKKVPTRLLGPIERHLMSEPPEDRRQDVIHPSELCKKDFCARAVYFRIRDNIQPTDKPRMQMQNIFDEGHFIHDKWQQRIWRMGNLYGKFTCRSCNDTRWSISPTICESCGAGRALLKYAEVTLFDDELMIAGHSDGWVKGLGDDFMIEVKSVGTGTIRMEAPALLAEYTTAEEAWKNVRRPFGTHIRQGMLYLELARRMVDAGVMDGPAPREMVFLYELKSNQQYKEFVVKANPEIVKDMLDLAYDIAHALRVTDLAPQCTLKISGSCKACAPFEGQA